MARDFGNSRFSNTSSGRRSYQETQPVVKTHVKLEELTYVDTAESVIASLKNRGNLLTTSKIRNLLSMISALYDEVRRTPGDKLSEEALGQIQYIVHYLKHQS